jgi:hypothetical protein
MALEPFDGGWELPASSDLRLPNVLDSVTSHLNQPPQQDQEDNLTRLSALSAQAERPQQSRGIK